MVFVITYHINNSSRWFSIKSLASFMPLQIYNSNTGCKITEDPSKFLCNQPTGTMNSTFCSVFHHTLTTIYLPLEIVNDNDHNINITFFISRLSSRKLESSFFLLSLFLYFIFFFCLYIFLLS